jgi:SAM-dependent methyltransferase
MRREYWERVGDRYEKEIFASSLADTRGVIRRRLDELADPRAVAADFGCGVGHYLPLLAKRFRVVHGIDFAEALLDQARERTRALDNVAIHRANLASGRAKLSLSNLKVAVCANVLISEDAGLRRGILRTIHRTLKPGGQLLLLVPSLESVLFSNQRLVEWNRRLGWSDADAVATGTLPARDVVRGLVRIDNVPTKHYLREEATVLLEEAGFTVSSSDKVEYRWDTEFETPPKWMKSPGPWDWLFVAKRSATQRATRR